MNKPLFALLTGPTGVGKTTTVLRVVERAQRLGLTCRGLLAPALRDSSGQKTGIVGVDLSTGERRTLSRTDQELGGPRLGVYSFDPAGLEWATGVVLDALTVPIAMPAAVGDAPSLVVVDEIGKLELWQGQGMAAILPLLAAGPTVPVLVIVRESLLDELLARLGEGRQMIFRASEENRDALPAEIAAAFLRPA